jgi:hypothetical protein
VLVEETEWVGVVGVVPTEGEVMVAAHATPAPNKSAHVAISAVRANVISS